MEDLGLAGRKLTFLIDCAALFLAVCLKDTKKKLLSMEDFGLAVRELTFLMDCAALFLDV